MDTVKFGEMLAERRKIMKLTQKNLADQLGVTDKAVSKWERGKSLPDVSLLTKLAESLDISLAELLIQDEAKEVKSSQDNALITSIADRWDDRDLRIRVLSGS